MKYLLISFFFLILTPLFGQIEEPLRIELAAEKDNHDYNYKLCEELGVVVYYKSNLKNKDTANWVLLHYDTNLTLIHNREFELPIEAEPNSAYYTNHNTYIIFQQKNKKNKVPHWFLATYNNDSSSVYIEQLPLTLYDLNYIKVYDQYLYCVSNEEKSIGTQIVHLPTKKIKDLYLEDSYIEQYTFLEIDTISKKLFVGVLKYPKQETTQSDLSLIESDLSFTNYSIIDYPKTKNYWFTSARGIISDTGRVLLLGTYSSSTENKIINYHCGVYATSYSKGNIEKIKYYNYTQLKSANAQNTTLETKNNSYELLLGRTFHNKDLFSLITEVFYKEYTYTSSYSNTFGYYHFTPTTVFAGYRFTNSYITTFDKDGNLLWDNYFPFQNVLTNVLYSKTKIYLDKDNYGYIYYNYGNNIYSTMVQNYNIIEPISTNKIITKYPTDRVEYTQNLQIEHWYNSSFIICGYQYIQNGGRKKKRFVFSMNKLVYE